MDAKLNTMHFVQELAPLGFFVVIFIVMIVIGVISANVARKRAEIRAGALIDLATKYRLTYSPGIIDTHAGGFFSLGSRTPQTDEFLAPFQHISPFGQGHSPEVRNIIRGAYGDNGVLIFDYTYKVTSSNGKTTTTTTYHVQVLMLTLPFWLPHFSMHPEGFLLALSEKFGNREIEFESEEFNKKWFVKGSDAKTIYDLLHPRAMERLLNVAPYRWEFGGNCLVVITNRHLEPIEVERALIDMTEFVALTPNYFRQDRKL